VVKPEEKKRQDFVKGEHATGYHAGQQTQPAKDRLAQAESTDREHLCFHQPENRPTDALELE
jgi:hypothetical protein